MSLFGRSSVLQDWFSEYCSPVVITVATAEVENTCLKNGLLLHELLGAFGHLDSLNTSIRISSGQSISISDARIRFERSTEARLKPSNVVEEVLKNSFEECNLSRLPNSLSELKVSMPSSWNKKIEQTILMKSLSFSEYEMISHPVVVLSVVSSSDVDPLLCMQELLSIHHLPVSLSTGQYDSEIYRVYVVLHDINDTKHVDPNAVYRRLQSKFPASQTRLLCINSLSIEAQNLQQPDMWSKYKIPICFPQNVPCIDSNAIRPVNPINGNIVIGSRLSLEDQMSIRDFCVALYQQDVIPSLERRISTLTRTVSDTRKGMRNVLKSFWRKPRDEPSSPNNRNNPNFSSNSVKYKFDRSETQILLLADTSFIVGDYDNAISMYKLVRDDYKSDRSNLHLAHTYLMIAISYMIYEPQRLREIQSQLEALTQLFITPVEPPHAITYFALLTTEIYNNKDFRLYIESAQFLLQAAGVVSRFPVLCALLTERAAGQYLLAGYSRRFVLHEILAGHKFRSVGGLPGRHAIMNFASAMIVIDTSRWGDMKAKLARAIAQELKTRSYSLIRGESVSIDDDETSKLNQKAIISLLQSLSMILSNDSNIGSIENITDASNILDELMNISTNPTLNSSASLSTNNLVLREPIVIGEGWSKVSTREILLNPLPLSIHTNKTIMAEITDLSIPDVKLSSLSIMIPFNGTSLVIPWTGNIVSNKSINLIHNISNAYSMSIISSFEYNQAEEMKIMSDIERNWGIDIESTNASNNNKTLAKYWMDGQLELVNRKSKYLDKNYQIYNNLSNQSIDRQISNNLLNSIAQIPFGENICLFIQLTNKLLTSINISNLSILINPLDQFDIKPIDIILNPKEVKDVCVYCKPKSLGSYTIDTISWNINNTLVIKKNIQKLGKLLHKTITQRTNKLRQEDFSMKFEVIPSKPLLTLVFEGISDEVLQGQVLKTTLLLINTGSSTASNIYLKLSQPCFVFTIDDNKSTSLIDLWGQSCSLIQLPYDVTIAPGDTYRLNAWLRLYSGGKQNISVLATYQSDVDNSDWRTSFVSIKTCVIPSVGLSVHSSSKASSTSERVLSVELINFLRSEIPKPPTKSSNIRLDRPRVDSSSGQIDLSNDFKGLIINDQSEASEGGLLESSCQIEGVWMLGCTQSINQSKYNWKSYIAKPSEHLSIPLHVNITTDTQTKKPFDRLVTTNLIPNKSKLQLTEQLKGHSDWIIPLSIDESYISDILDRFLCMSYSSRLFRKDIKEYAQISHENSLETNIPKTITQVRKENRQKDMLVDVSLDNDNDESIDKSSNILDNGIFDKKKAKPSSGIPSTSYDLASIQASDNSVMVIVVWKVMWQGKIRLGMHHISDIPISLSNNVITNRPHRSFYDITNKQISDYLLVGINHVNNITLPNTSESTRRGVIVNVNFEMRSIANYPIRVSVEAIDRRDKKITNQSTNNITTYPINSNLHAYILPTITSDESYISVSKSSSRGLQWLCKTKYMDLIIEPFSTIVLPFYVSIAKSGIFDLKRFRVSVSSDNEVGDNIFYKYIPGQSLIEVLDSNLE